MEHTCLCVYAKTLVLGVQGSRTGKPWSGGSGVPFIVVTKRQSLLRSMMYLKNQS